MTQSVFDSVASSSTYSLITSVCMNRADTASSPKPQSERKAFWPEIVALTASNWVKFGSSLPISA